MTQAVAIQPALKIINGQITTTSLQVAEHFGRQHKAVLRAIANLECSPEFAKRNFAPSDYIDNTGRKLPAYSITRDGFTLLAMGFTGKQALQFKLAYIDAFNRMEEQLRQSPPAELQAQLQRLRAQLATTGRASALFEFKPL